MQYQVVLHSFYTVTPITHLLISPEAMGMDMKAMTAINIAMRISTLTANIFVVFLTSFRSQKQQQQRQKTQKKALT